MHILFVEDEKGLAKVISDSLLFKGFSVSHCTTGQEGFESYIEKKPDIILLDVMVPELDGFELAIKIRELDATTPIIFITARTQTKDVLKGFEMGANDYIKKPFVVEELLARMNVHLKKTGRTLSEEFSIGDYIFEPKNQKLIFNNKITKLSHRENEILRKLCERKDEILKRDDIIADFWGMQSFFPGRTLDVFISRLRNRLKGDPRISIISIKKAGYLLVIAPE